MAGWVGARAGAEGTARLNGWRPRSAPLRGVYRVPDRLAAGREAASKNPKQLPVISAGIIIIIEPGLATANPYVSNIREIST